MNDPLPHGFPRDPMAMPDGMRWSAQSGASNNQLSRATTGRGIKGLGNNVGKPLPKIGPMPHQWMFHPGAPMGSRTIKMAVSDETKVLGPTGIPLVKPKRRPSSRSFLNASRRHTEARNRAKRKEMEGEVKMSAFAAPAPPPRLIGRMIPLGERRDEFTPEEQAQIDQEMGEWIGTPDFLHTQATPVTKLVNSPVRKGLLHGLGGAAVGGAAGAGIGKLIETLSPSSDAFTQANTGMGTTGLGAILGALGVGSTAALRKMYKQRKENARTTEIMRRLPAGATKYDFDNAAAIYDAIGARFNSSDKSASFPRLPKRAIDFTSAGKIAKYRTATKITANSIPSKYRAVQSGQPQHRIYEKYQDTVKQLGSRKGQVKVDGNEYKKAEDEEWHKQALSTKLISSVLANAHRTGKYISPAAKRLGITTKAQRLNRFRDKTLNWITGPQYGASINETGGALGRAQRSMDSLMGATPIPSQSLKTIRDSGGLKTLKPDILATLTKAMAKPMKGSKQLTAGRMSAVREPLRASKSVRGRYSSRHFDARRWNMRHPGRPQVGIMSDIEGTFPGSSYMPTLNTVMSSPDYATLMHELGHAYTVPNLMLNNPSTYSGFMSGKPALMMEALANRRATHAASALAGKKIKGMPSVTQLREAYRPQYEHYRLSTLLDGLNRPSARVMEQMGYSSSEMPAWFKRMQLPTAKGPRPSSIVKKKLPPTKKKASVQEKESGLIDKGLRLGLRMVRPMVGGTNIATKSVAHGLRVAEPALTRAGLNTGRVIGAPVRGFFTRNPVGRAIGRGASYATAPLRVSNRALQAGDNYLGRYTKGVYRGVTGHSVTNAGQDAFGHRVITKPVSTLAKIIGAPTAATGLYSWLGPSFKKSSVRDDLSTDKEVSVQDKYPIDLVMSCRNPKCQYEKVARQITGPDDGYPRSGRCEKCGYIAWAGVRDKEASVVQDKTASVQDDLGTDRQSTGWQSTGWQSTGEFMPNGYNRLNLLKLGGHTINPSYTSVAPYPLNPLVKAANRRDLLTYLGLSAGAGAVAQPHGSNALGKNTSHGLITGLGGLLGHDVGNTYGAMKGIGGYTHVFDKYPKLARLLLKGGKPLGAIAGLGAGLYGGHALSNALMAKKSESKNWTKLHHIITRPPSFEDIKRGLGYGVNKAEGRARNFARAGLQHGGAGLGGLSGLTAGLTLASRLGPWGKALAGIGGLLGGATLGGYAGKGTGNLLLGSPNSTSAGKIASATNTQHAWASGEWRPKVKPSPDTRNENVDLSDVMYTHRRDSQIPPRGTSHHLYGMSDKASSLRQVKTIYNAPDTLNKGAGDPYGTRSAHVDIRTGSLAPHSNLFGGSLKRGSDRFLAPLPSTAMLKASVEGLAGGPVQAMRDQTAPIRNRLQGYRDQLQAAGRNQGTFIRGKLQPPAQSGGINVPPGLAAGLRQLPPGSLQRANDQIEKTWGLGPGSTGGAPSPQPSPPDDGGIVEPGSWAGKPGLDNTVGQPAAAAPAQAPSAPVRGLGSPDSYRAPAPEIAPPAGAARFGADVSPAQPLAGSEDLAQTSMNSGYIGAGSTPNDVQAQSMQQISNDIPSDPAGLRALRPGRSADTLPPAMGGNPGPVTNQPMAPQAPQGFAQQPQQPQQRPQSPPPAFSGRKYVPGAGMVGNVQAGRIAQERARIAKEQQQMRAARAARMSGQPKANIASSLGPTASPTLTPSAPSKPYQIGDGLGPMMKDTSGDDAQPAPDSDLKPYDFSKSDGGMGPLG